MSLLLIFSHINFYNIILKCGKLGGCVNFGSWRKNPQFLLNVAKDTTVSVILEALDFETNTEKPHIGFYIVKSNQENFKKILLTPSDIVIDCKYASKQTGK